MKRARVAGGRAVDERTITAFHEAGHIVAAFAVGSEVKSATIVERGAALGEAQLTELRPTARQLREWEWQAVLSYLNNAIVRDLAGYAAEEEWARYGFALAPHICSASMRGHNDVASALRLASSAVKVLRKPDAEDAVRSAVELCLLFGHAARRFLRRPAVRSAGQQLADALLSKGTVKAREIKAVAAPSLWVEDERKTAYLRIDEVRRALALLYGG
jgi:hypothetical protein